MLMISTNEFKSGLKIILDNEPYVIIENEYVKSGKGQAFNRLKLRKLLSGRIIEKTFKSGDSVELADIKDVSLNYLYKDKEFYYFINTQTFEQISADIRSVGKSAKWLLENNKCMLTLWNGSPIAVMPENFVELRVIDTVPGLKGDTQGNGGKLATLETGAIIRVPLFIAIGEVIKVDTRKGEYISRTTKS
ncbi:elongation factor P [Candidatus Photodesmus katoptron]|uniref:Elongation factor P n=1 Tax=Candidatus Photodesmus katoptron Akat1 TaxID=1236703 RepID=S3DGF1_9GAMM|nr:elongation factor P [Candidatus Photodesmus katoptron]EPE37522.1 translation elongation factor P [Candidatus Photodesmus katoptron Akat1]KEY90171.1 elongation factor P [Candidatus Photodesmus katoptron]